MNRRMSAPKIPVLFFVALFALIISAFAYSVPDDTVVYVTPTGTKYHREDCSYTTSVRSMTIKEAERKGYGACSRCDPDRLTGEYHSKQNEKKSSTSGSRAENKTTSVKPEVPKDSPTEPQKENDISVAEMMWQVLKWIVLIPTVFLWGIALIVEIVNKIFKRK